MVRGMTKKKKHYLNNKRFEEVIFGYQKDKAAYEDELVEMFTLLYTNVFMTFKFNVDKDDAYQECFILFAKVLDKFTPDKGSAFNYFTTVLLNHLRYIYTKNKKYNQKILEYRKEMGDIDINLDFTDEI
jgi:DNA-directed RNA polymerase specialized sigma24 family protein